MSKITKKNLLSAFKKYHLKNKESIQLVNNRIDDLPVSSNPNLLINGDFQVWQRGINFTDIQQYCADRWFFVSYANGVPLGSISKENNMLKIYNFNDKQNYIRQILEKDFSSKLAGKIVTLSVDLLADNTIDGDSIFLQIVTTQDEIFGYTNAKSHSKVISKNEISTLSRHKLTIKIPEGTQNIAIQIGAHESLGLLNNNANLYISNVKLELGSVATPFISRSYNEELLDCKRYYEVILPYESNGTSIDDSQSNILIKWDVEKRRIPTVSIIPDNGNVILNHYGKRIFTTSQINTTYTIINNEIYLGLLSGFSGLTFGSSYLLGNSVTIDAEIY